MKYRKLIWVVVAVQMNMSNLSATEYSVAPQLRATMRGEDNIRGETANPQSAFGFDVGGLMDFQAVNESLTSDLIPRVNFRRFVVADANDANEYGVAFNNDYIRDYYQAGVDFSYSHDSTLTTEASDSGGRVNTVAGRDGINIRPSVGYMLTDRLTALAGLLYNTVSYAETSGVDFVNYNYKQGNLGANYRWGEKAIVVVNGYVSQFNTGTGESKTRSYSGTAGITWHWSKSLETSGSVGWNQSEIHILEQGLPSTLVDVSAGGPLATATIQKLFEYTILRLDYSRQVSPTGRGVQSEADRIELGLSRRVTERLICQLEGVYDMQSAELSDIQGSLAASSLNRDYMSASANFRYQLARDWVINSTYRFSHRTSGGGAANTSEGNSVFVSVEFSGQPIQF